MFDIKKFASEHSETLKKIYGSNTAGMTERIARAVESFKEIYGDGEIAVFSVPGRSEI